MDQLFIIRLQTGYTDYNTMRELLYKENANILDFTIVKVYQTIYYK